MVSETIASTVGLEELAIGPGTIAPLVLPRSALGVVLRVDTPGFEPGRPGLQPGALPLELYILG